MSIAALFISCTIRRWMRSAALFFQSYTLAQWLAGMLEFVGFIGLVVGFLYLVNA